MPKLKTKKSIQKRFKITKNGKVIASKTLKRHMLTDRSPKKKKRQARQDLIVDKSHHRTIKEAMPYNV